MSQQITRKIETALAAHLGDVEGLNEVQIVAYSDVVEAPEHPSILVHCLKVRKTAGEEMCRANVTASLFYDCEDEVIDPPKYEAAAAALECALEDVATLQAVFNLDPLADPDPRDIKGIHLHDIDEFQTDNETEDMTWAFGVGLTLLIEDVIS